MYRKLFIVLTGAAVLMVAGCGGKSAVKSPVTAATAAEGNAVQGNGAADAGMSAANAGTVGDTGGNGASAPAGVGRLVYFDFDSAEIRPEFVAVIAAHARAVSANASIRVRLEGHTDERGSPEYNIGLAERRAQAVRRTLLLQGVGEAQAATVSYGEERPAAAGQTEADWAKNRRVEIVYLN